jgi:hypothetical protein
VTTRPNPDSLPEGQARQVLERAAQLDATARLHVSIADLRVAALEAGISERSLEQALAELKPVELPGSVAAAPAGPRAKPPVGRRGSRLVALGATLLLLATGILYRTYTVAQMGPPPVMVEVPAAEPAVRAPAPPPAQPRDTAPTG